MAGFSMRTSDTSEGLAGADEADDALTLARKNETKFNLLLSKRMFASKFNFIYSKRDENCLNTISIPTCKFVLPWLA